MPKTVLNRPHAYCVLLACTNWCSGKGVIELGTTDGFCTSQLRGEDLTSVYSANAFDNFKRPAYVNHSKRNTHALNLLPCYFSIHTASSFLKLLRTRRPKYATAYLFELMLEFEGICTFCRWSRKIYDHPFVIINGVYRTKRSVVDGCKHHVSKAALHTLVATGCHVLNKQSL